MEQINNLMMKGLESAAQLSIGQAFLRGVDRMMWTIEKSVQWSLPRTETNTEENGKSFGEIEFIRPLPWILFLPSIIILRIVRASLNVAALILGYPKIQPVDMVRFMQKNRRRLRAIKSRGLKNMREKNPAIEKAHPTTIGIRENKNAENSMLSPNHVNDTKRKYSELSSSDDECSESDDEPIIDKIDRMANEDSESDDDFIPEGEVSIDSVSSAESDLMNISNTEIQDIKAEKEDMEKIFILKDSEKEEKNPNNHLQVEAAKLMLEKFCAINESGREIYANEEFSDKKKLEDIEFYSPISSKSISPEQSLSPNKNESQSSIERAIINACEDKLDHLETEKINGNVNKDTETENAAIDNIKEKSPKSTKFNNKMKKNKNKKK